MPLIPLIIGFLISGLVWRFVAALGVGVASFLSFSYVIEEITTMIQTSYSGLPVAVIQLATLSGVTQALGFLLSAITIRAAFMFTPRWVPIVGGGS